MTPPSDTGPASRRSTPSARGGFDCVLGNPPWERVKLQEKEWFAERVPQIANAANAAVRGRLIAAVATDRPDLHRQFLEDRRLSEAASNFLRNSDRFPLCGRGDVNLYTVFAESMRDSVSPTGRAGMIVPSGIATDDTTKFFFQHLVARASLVSLFDFENALPLFEGVHRSYKFCCLTLRAPAPDDHAMRVAPPAEFVFFAHRVEDLEDETRRFTLTRDDVALVNPNTRTCPIFRSKVDAELTKHIYRRVPVLIDETKPDGNPWGVEFTRLFDMSNDSHLFRTREQLEANGWRLSGGSYQRDDQRCVPLYEGKMVAHFDHRVADVVRSDTAVIRQSQPEAISIRERTFPDRYSRPMYWVPSTAVATRLAAAAGQQWLFGWRDISSATNARTFVAAVIPPAAVGNKYPLMTSDRGGSAVAVLAACMSSFVLDYTARQKLGGVTLNFFIVRQLPVLPPQVFCLEETVVQGTWRHTLFTRTLELSATADDMALFSRDLWPEGDGAVFRWDPDRRFEIRCELDAIFFHLYLGDDEEWRRTASPELLAALPAPRHAITYIMETFPAVQDEDLTTHGTYRTKERILALYDRLQECLARGTPFTSELDPPPGPPTNPDGSFRSLPAWPPGTPRPAGYPSHIHPPISHRSGSHSSEE